jgi:signal transduction histidine kinase
VELESKEQKNQSWPWPYFQFQRPTRRLTLRMRLALWTSGMFVVLCLGLLTFVNLTAGNNRSTELQSASVIGFGLVTLIGGMGAYWLAGIALRPVRQVSQATRTISASTLDTRLNLDGPHDELKELAQAFDAMLDRLERNFEQQRRFTADAAHELRTPLANLRVNLEVIEADPNATLDDYRQLTATLERGLSRLERLVSDLLTLAIEEASLTHAEVSLGPLLEDLMVDLAPLAQREGIEIKLESHTTSLVEADSTLLARVFINLVENAIRYNHPGGQIIIKAWEESQVVVVTVADTGSGIAIAEQPYIFERFYRVDKSRSRHKGGAGLGLSIVSHLVQQHKGQVELIESSEQGSIFRVCLPLLGRQ